MRNIHKKIFLEKLGEVWEEQCPNWRFGQMICNLQDAANNDLFYYSEEDFERLVNEYFELRNNQNQQNF